ncbi:uncharacterized protein LOC112883572 isoform X3 [Panicum hallii]|uniref:uncharacterized protein LOC112883572 isoform X3 n=1 Tax=Panicum hallii TaxID=206008 RepID=UPI000DF4D21E|nr:uncharacterized protein LOC112883572 isoform X3 [Panicum hallii]
MAPPGMISRKRQAKSRLPASDLVHSQESHEEQGNKCSQKRCDINMRSSPKCVVDAIAALSLDQKNKIKELGFGELLKFSLDGFGDRYMLEFLMDHTDPENMEIRVGGGDKNLPINEHVVQCVLGVPTGKGRDTPDYPNMESELNNLRTELGVKTDKIKSSDLIAKINGGGTDYLTIRCFFILLCYKLLLPSSQNHVTEREVALTKSPKDIAEVNWAKAVVDNLRLAARKWHSNKLAVSKKKRTLSGCVACLLFRSMVGTCYSMGSRQLVPNISIEPLHSNFFQDLSPRKREIATSYFNTVDTLMGQILKERNLFMISMGVQDAQNSSRAAEPQGGDSGIQDDPRNKHFEAYHEVAADQQIRIVDGSPTAPPPAPAAEDGSSVPPPPAADGSLTALAAAAAEDGGGGSLPPAASLKHARKRTVRKETSKMTLNASKGDKDEDKNPGLRRSKRRMNHPTPSNY